MPELERNARIGFGRAERHLRNLSRRHGGQRITESLCETLHHAAIYCPFRELRHTFRHHDIVVRRAAHMVVRDSFLYGFAQSGKIGVELRYIVFEERLFHRNESLLAFHNVAGIAQRVIRVIDMQFEAAEVMYLETSLFLCRSTQNHTGKGQRQNNLFHFFLVFICCYTSMFNKLR